MRQYIINGKALFVIVIIFNVKMYIIYCLHWEIEIQMQVYYPKTNNINLFLAHNISIIVL